jgi:hypothetical protein
MPSQYMNPMTKPSHTPILSAGLRVARAEVQQRVLDYRWRTHRSYARHRVGLSEHLAQHVRCIEHLATTQVDNRIPEGDEHCSEQAGNQPFANT